MNLNLRFRSGVIAWLSALLLYGGLHNHSFAASDGAGLLVVVGKLQDQLNTVFGQMGSKDRVLRVTCVQAQQARCRYALGRYVQIAAEGASEDVGATLVTIDFPLGNPESDLNSIVTCIALAAIVAPQSTFDQQSDIMSALLLAIHEGQETAAGELGQAHFTLRKTDAKNVTLEVRPRHALSAK